MKYANRIFIICLLFTASLEKDDNGMRDLEISDIIKYMSVHKEIIEDAQALYSSSIDSDVLSNINEVLGEFPQVLDNSESIISDVVLVGEGENEYLRIVGNRSIEKSPEIDRKYITYCNDTGVTYCKIEGRSIILCKNGKIYEITLRGQTRKKRDVEEHGVPKTILKEIQDYINNCGNKCIFSESLMQLIKDCIEKQWDSCDRTFYMAIKMLREPATYQPSINHFFDNYPYRKNISLHSSLETLPIYQQLLQTIPRDCNGKIPSSYPDASCSNFMSSDINSVYKLFNNHVEGHDKLFVLQTTKQYKDCEPHDHVWSDVKLTTSFTGEHDSVIYNVKAINEKGANVTLHCISTICNLCIKEVPVLLSGQCSMKHSISESGHILELCNKEKEKVGYFVRLLHGGSRIDNGYSYRSRFLLMNLYTYAHEKLIGINPRLTDDTEGPQIIKGSIRKETCEYVRAGNINRDWLQYYVKCGQNIYHHNEYLSETYRCNLKYETYKFSSLLKWICYNWYYIRFFLIITVSILFMYILWFIGLYRYIAMFLCMITSPISYILYKYWPCFARCTRCGLPWMPWHKCNEICLCGETFNDDHRSICEFYKVDKTTNDALVKNSELFSPVNLSIPSVGSMSYINHVKSQRRRMNQRLSTLIEVEDNSNNTKEAGPKATRIFQVFSSFRNPFTVFTVRFSIFLVVYIVFCILTPVSLAECVKCTDRCHWNGQEYTEDCRGISDGCICILTTSCRDNRTALSAKSSMGNELSERILYTLNGCIKNDLPYQVDYFLAAILEIQGCYRNITKSAKRRQKIFLKMSASIPIYAKIYILERGSKSCGDITRYLNENLDMPRAVLEDVSSILNSRLEVDQSKEIVVRGLQSITNGTGNLHEQSDFEKTVKPIQDVVEETKKEEISRKNGELLQEFHNIITLLNYNGSIFGRDHSVTIPQPPSFIQHVYTAQSTETSTIIDMSMQAVSGSASAFRPIHNGKELPLTFIISVPEVAGVYAMKYLYTACKTSVIDTVRYDKCVGSCDSCYEHLNENVLDSTKLTKFHNKDTREKISFDNPNTWGCEGSGCWTINTGCLCAYCSNIPDPSNCLDVYTASYLSSKALVCLSINEDYQCEHIILGRPVERKGKIQILLQGSDEWSSLIKSEMIAISRSSGKLYTGVMNGLGESSGNFGSPQYNRNLSLLYKVPDVDAHYVCNSGIDQEVIFDSCFKDTWPMVKELKESAAFFLDSRIGTLYHVGKNVGTLRIILNVPVDKIEWKTVGLSLSIRSATCMGCYGCVNGVHCNMEIESSHSGMVYIYANPCVVRVATINILRGSKQYNVTMDCMKKPVNSYVYLKDGNGKDIAKKSLSMTLKEGNTPRTTERNSTNHGYDITGHNDNTLSSFGDFLKKYNPISAISNFFSSSLIHWILYIILTIVIVLVIVLSFYYIANIALRKVTNKVILGKQE